ncbi:adenylate cyclase [Mycena alexandri]|uniref:Adenylate cyclase n=1 Tax=Mycena alexandri TaxID=1745969 RepID=A0AAD6WUD1_9AGAR|nr:adenylate cyclase [Mycena alexandri]
MYMPPPKPKRGSRDRSNSPPPHHSLRKSKSTEFLQSARHKVSIKVMGLLGRGDKAEYPYSNNSTAFQPTPSTPPILSSRSYRFRRSRPKLSLEGAPPVPDLPAYLDDSVFDTNANLNIDQLESQGIIKREVDGNDTISPGSEIYSSSSSNSQSGHQVTSSSLFKPTLPPRTPDAMGPTDVSEIHRDLRGGDFPIPESWAVTPAHRPRRDLEEESTSDYEGTSRSNAADLPRWKIRIYGPDNNDCILRISTADTVGSLTSLLDAKFFLSDRETYEMYLKERGRGERLLKQSARPAHILKTALEQAGYDETDGYDLLGGAGMPEVPFLLKFVYRSQFLGPTNDKELELNNLVHCNLSGRSLTTIPVTLYYHANSIQLLRLSQNPITDIPLDFVQSCTSLRILHLSHMFLKRVPHNVRYSQSLTLLDLSSNRIASLDDAHLEDLPRLTKLNVQNNRLERLPESFRLLRRLIDLNLSNNKFETFPVAVTELATGLTSLDISFNSISALPPEIGRLSNLVQLVVVGNQIAALPWEFSGLTHLRELDCRRNRIADLSVACMLPQLTSLSADHNSLQAFSFSLGPSLTVLDVSHNDITELVVSRGPIGSAPFGLTSLDLSNAKLSVLEDATLAQLTSLRTLKLDRNSFRSIPESLGDLTWLVSLSCADNALSDFPESVGRLQRLNSLDLHNNSLTALPVSLWNCASLTHLNVTSNLLTVWHDPPPLGLPSFSLSALILSTTFAPRRPSVSTTPNIPPLAHSLEMLYLAENSLTDEMLHPLMILKALQVLNLSFNDIQELPSNFFKHLTRLEEVFLSGNRLTHLPSKDLPSLDRLSTLFLNGNHLQHLPQELGKVKSLTLLDVGNNMLKYNINNLDYDWNWNFNKNLVYLNLSGNQQLQIKSDRHGQRPSTSSMSRQSMSGFSGLTRLRVLGLMDVTFTTTGTHTTSYIPDIPDESDDRRVRTSSSTVNGLLYGIADTLGKNQHPHMMDLVYEFRGIKKDTVFAMFGRAYPTNQVVESTANGLAKFLKDNFIRVFISQLHSLDPGRAEGVPDALRRSFLKLNQDFHDTLFGPGAVRKMSVAGGPAITDPSLLHNGASGIVVYIVGKRLYVANAGNALAIVSRGGTAHLLSRKHEPYDREETARIRAAEGWISPPGLVNDELDISRSFGFYHLLPVVNARPDIFVYDLTSIDDRIIIANRGLWDYVQYQTAVDIVQRAQPMEAAQKLRDLAISYGAEGSTMIMVVCLENMFKVGPPAAPAVPEDRRRRRGVRVTDRTLDRLRDEVPPPVGHVAIVFTGIKGSSHLWEASPSGMFTALHLHNSLMRRFLRSCGGYEVRTEGDSFMCSFPTVLAAVWWCLTIQMELLNVAWPQDILDCADGRAVYDVKGRLIYRGLAVRIGIDWGSPLCQTDPVTNRMDYFGPIVNRSQRIQGSAAGGHIMCSSDVIREINAKILETEPETEYSDAQPQEAIDAIRRLDPVVVPVGEDTLQGHKVPEMLSLVFPSMLIGRKDLDNTAVLKRDPQMPKKSKHRPPQSPPIGEMGVLRDEAENARSVGVALGLPPSRPHSHMLAKMERLLQREPPEQQAHFEAFAKQLWDELSERSEERRSKDDVNSSIVVGAIDSQQEVGSVTPVAALLYAQHRRAVLLEQALSSADLRDMLQSCEQLICASLLAIFGSQEFKNKVLLLKGDRAQSFLDTVQDRIALNVTYIAGSTSSRPTLGRE